MNSALLLEHYARIADAPDAIARLRRFVLDLAVRGKLVHQNVADEPASELLKRIAANNAGRRKASEQLALDESQEFAVPSGWELVPLGNVVAHHLGGGTPSKTVTAYWDGDIRWASVKDVGKSKYLDDTIDRITPEGLVNSSSNLIEPGHLIVVTRMGLGKVSINRAEVAINQDLRALKFGDGVDLEYAYNFFLTHAFEGTGLTVKGIKLAELLHFPFPLPPFAEQQRIVAKVEELMALCDQLEAARAEREAGRNRLTAATLARLNAPDPETFPADARFALDNLTPLTTRPDQIKQLRQTILNLAVRGKLVEQDATDGSGLNLMAALKPGDGRGRRTIAVRTVEPPEEYLGIPDNWTWARIHELGVTQTGTSPSSANPDFFGDFIPFVKPGDLNGANISYEGPGLSEEGVSQSRLAPAATVLMVCIGATLGKVNITDRNVCFNQQINSVTPYMPGTAAFLALALKASGFQELAWSKAGTGTLPIISKGKWEILPVPVPPLAEQHRIVAKVDELMALCDQLEASIIKGEQTRSRLLESVLHNALEPA